MLVVDLFLFFVFAAAKKRFHIKKLFSWKQQLFHLFDQKKVSKICHFFQEKKIH